MQNLPNVKADGATCRNIPVLKRQTTICYITALSNRPNDPGTWVQSPCWDNIYILSTMSRIALGPSDGGLNPTTYIPLVLRLRTHGTVRQLADVPSCCGA